MERKYKAAGVWNILCGVVGITAFSAWWVVIFMTARSTCWLNGVFLLMEPIIVNSCHLLSIALGFETAFKKKKVKGLKK